MKRRERKPLKKLTAMFLALALIFSLTACADGTNGAGNNGSENNGGGNDAGADEGTGGTADNSAGQDTLIVYFSHSGNTEAVDQQIADITGGTLAEIQRAAPYTNVNTEGEEELNNNARPEITVNIDSIDNYQTIFVGYPIWWDEAPMVIDTFLESYDFTGKTLVPFCTSASDDIDNSLHIFHELAPQATIAEALTANDETDIAPWLQRLGYR